jgi:probable addiction module antidote protein
VAKARGFASLTQITGLNRESLYKTMTKGKNPRLMTIMDVLTAVGCKIKLEPIKKSKNKAA